jgi:hypothetical protein
MDAERKTYQGWLLARASMAAEQAYQAVTRRIFAV